MRQCREPLTLLDTTFFCVEPEGHQCVHFYRFLESDVSRFAERAERAEADNAALRGLLRTARPLAQATLNVALRWNDHNYNNDAPHQWAKKAADSVGFPRTPDGDSAAVEWLEKVDAALADTARALGEGR